MIHALVSTVIDVSVLGLWESCQAFYGSDSYDYLIFASGQRGERYLPTNRV